MFVMSQLLIQKRLMLLRERTGGISFKFVWQKIVFFK
nr:MAG TPA: hypothetical protein [Caudoviricetes sp.]